MADLGPLSEGWIAAAGATIGAILLKVAEKLLAAKKERFDQSVSLQTQADERIKALWVRIDTLQAERDALWGRFHTAEDQHDARMREEQRKYQTLEQKYDELHDRYRELRLLLRGRNIPEPPEGFES